jgi:hypothetical protein
MKKRSKLLVAIPVAVLLLLPAAAAALTFSGRFGVITNVKDLNITCGPNDTTGPSTVRLAIKATRFTGGLKAGQRTRTRGRANHLVAFFPGGSLEIRRFGVFHLLPSGFPYPCPAATGSFRVSLQAFRCNGNGDDDDDDDDGCRRVSGTARVTVRLHRVAPAS